MRCGGFPRTTASVPAWASAAASGWCCLVRAKGKGEMASRNYRSAGRTMPGERHRGFAPGDDEVTPASIPSKYEAVLPAEAKEVVGFGGSTSRFGAVTNDRPGPGAYHRQNSLVRDASQNGSVSMKGYSIGFVSREDRFPARDGRFRRSVPGPGSYPLPELGDATVASRRMFVDTGKYREDETLPLRNAELPGPGEYALDVQTRRRPGKSQERSYFMASDAPKGLVIGDDKPAVGSYNVQHAFDAAKTGGLEEYTGKCATAFSSKTRRYVQPAQVSTETPGPGSYRVNEADQYTRKRSIRHQNSTFMFKGNPDRFHGSNIVQRRAPGPGWYSRDILRSSTQPDAAPSSAFASTTTRAKFVRNPEDRPPGPAYYHAQPVDKRAFHLNMSGRFVT